MMRVRFRIRGMQRLIARIATLEKTAAKRVMRKVLRAGGQVMAKEVKARIKAGRYSTRTLYKSIGVRIYAKRSTGKMYSIIGPKTKFIKQTPQGKRWASKYAHIVEGGRKAYTRQPKPILAMSKKGNMYSYMRRGVRIGAVQGIHFIRDAARSAASKVRSVMWIKAKEEMRREANAK